MDVVTEPPATRLWGRRAATRRRAQPSGLRGRLPPPRQSSRARRHPPDGRWLHVLVRWAPGQKTEGDVAAEAASVVSLRNPKKRQKTSLRDSVTPHLGGRVESAAGRRERRTPPHPRWTKATASRPRATPSQRPRESAAARREKTHGVRASTVKVTRRPHVKFTPPTLKIHAE